MLLRPSTWLILYLLSHLILVEDDWGTIYIEEIVNSGAVHLQCRPKRINWRPRFINLLILILHLLVYLVALFLLLRNECPVCDRLLLLRKTVWISIRVLIVIHFPRYSISFFKEYFIIIYNKNRQILKNITKLKREI